MNNSFSSKQIQVVSSFDELANTTFAEEINALCWQRKLQGNFVEIVNKLQLQENITEVSQDDLLSLNLSSNGEIARAIILKDLELLTNFGAAPSLNLLKNYERDEELDFISTDVYSYHVDRSPIATDTFLCTYHGASSDILPNADAEQKIQIQGIRAKLKDLYQISEDDLDTFAKENYFDLHYQAKPNTKPINLGNGNLWKLAVDHPQQKVLPCIHRAPVENEGEYRLLLIC
jgi:hypothetical protein